MVEKSDITRDKLTYTFTLRDGLKFHDGQPVRSAECIGRSSAGQARFARPELRPVDRASWTAVTTTTFALKLKKPFPLTLEALGKL